MDMERGKRGRKFSVYVGDKSVEEQAFWDMAFEHLRPEDTSRIEWAVFFKRICKLIKEDREKQKNDSSEYQQLQKQMLEMNLKINEIEKYLKNPNNQTPAPVVVNNQPPTSKQELTKNNQEEALNELRRKADEMAEADW